MKNAQRIEDQRGFQLSNIITFSKAIKNKHPSSHCACCRLNKNCRRMKTSSSLKGVLPVGGLQNS